jgi:RNA polymerase sigma-70 factor (ECF subfamily)
MIVAGNASLAQEAVQEAFLRYYVQRAKGELPAGRHRWLFRVTRNYILDHHKSSSARTSVSLDQALTYGDERQSPHALLERSEAVARALRILSPRELECLQLRSDGFTYREISEILGIETGTVASLLARAGKKIRQASSQREVCEGHGTSS